jgi:hypothetical protein
LLTQLKFNLNRLQLYKLNVRHLASGYGFGEGQGFRLAVDENKPLNSRFPGATGALTGAAKLNELDGQHRRMARQDYARSAVSQGWLPRLSNQ